MEQRGIPRQILRESRRLYGTNAPVFIDIAQGTYSLAKLDLLLEFLQREDWRPASIPASFNMGDALNENTPQSIRLVGINIDENMRCINLFQVVTQSMMYIAEVCPVDLREQTVAKIGAHLDEILCACLFLLRPGTDNDPDIWHNPLQMCSALSNLSSFDPALERQMKASEKFARFLVAAWCANEREKNYPFISLDVTTMQGGRACSISGLFADSLRDERFRAMLSCFLTGHSQAKDIRDCLVDATVRRCEYYTSLKKRTVEDQLDREKRRSMGSQHQPHTPVEIVAGMLKQISAVVKGLSKIPILSQELLDAGYAQSLFKAIRSWVLDKSVRGERSRAGRERAASVLFSLQRWLEDQSTLSEGHWRAVEESYLIIVRSGYLELLRELLRSVRGAYESNPAYDNMVRCASIIKRRCGMHSCDTLGAALIETLAKLCPREDQIERLGGRADDASEAVWHAIVADIWALDSIDFTEQVNLCDNTKCTGGRQIIVKARICSGCLTHTYCSRACQEEDWEAFHSGECAAARDDVAARQANGAPLYTQKMRQHHADFTVARQAFLSPRDQGTQSLLTVQEITSYDITEHSLEDYLHVRGIEARSKAPGAQRSAESTSDSDPFVPKHHYLNMRIKAVIDASRTPAEIDAGVRLFAAAYAFCDQKVTVLVRVAKSSTLTMDIDSDDDSEDSFSIDDERYQCFNVITKLEKLDRNDHSV